MVRSNQRREEINRRYEAIEKQKESANSRFGEQFRNAIEYPIPITLHKIRRECEQPHKFGYITRQKVVRIPAHEKHAIIRGSNGAIIAYRAPLNDPEVLN